ncbi:MAG: phosphomannose isomerase type II C-terminal cupin domain [Gammaproteobacteria bacterium]|nr:phosphomannose isomerase type II C-terminal cupin domain [Gammaproteobacteria bacterium]
MQSNITGKIYERPWGTYKTLELGNGYQVKIITVNPGGQLSLQKHFKRSEHWVVIEGELTITVDATKKSYKVNEAVYIPKESAHRLENQTNSPAAIIEVQIGSYLGEDDIERLEDIYGRN